MSKILSEYLVTFSNNQNKKVVAANVSEVAKAFDSTTLPIVSLTRTATAVEVNDDGIPKVPFTVTVSPAEAATAGCHATPAAFTVEAGEEVIFTALLGAGYAFAGWYRNGVKLSGDAVAAIKVLATASESTVAEYTAMFTAL